MKRKVAACLLLISALFSAEQTSVPENPITITKDDEGVAKSVDYTPSTKEHVKAKETAKDTWTFTGHTSLGEPIYGNLRFDLKDNTATYTTENGKKITLSPTSEKIDTKTDAKGRTKTEQTTAFGSHLESMRDENGDLITLSYSSAHSTKTEAKKEKADNWSLKIVNRNGQVRQWDIHMNRQTKTISFAGVDGYYSYPSAQSLQDLIEAIHMSVDSGLSAQSAILSALIDLEWGSIKPVLKELIHLYCNKYEGRCDTPQSK